MSGLIDKIKGVKALSAGSKVPNTPLKEDNPEQASVVLSNLTGTST